MSAEISLPSPVVVSISGIKNSRMNELPNDAFGNQVIESIIRVVFPTFDQLIPTLEHLKRSGKKTSFYMESPLPDFMTVAKSAFSAIGAEGTKQISLTADSPVIVTISDVLREKDSLGNAFIEGVLCAVFPTEENFVETHASLLEANPDIKIQIHMPAQVDPIEAAKRLLASVEACRPKEMATSGSSVISDVREDYFSSPNQSPVPKTLTGSGLRRSTSNS